MYLEPPSMIFQAGRRTISPVFISLTGQTVSSPWVCTKPKSLTGIREVYFITTGAAIIPERNVLLFIIVIVTILYPLYHDIELGIEGELRLWVFGILEVVELEGFGLSQDNLEVTD